MCRRVEVQKAQAAQNAAADALIHACRGVCSDDIGKALAKVYDDTVAERVPDDFIRLLDRLQ